MIVVCAITDVVFAQKCSVLWVHFCTLCTNYYVAGVHIIQGLIGCMQLSCVCL